MAYGLLGHCKPTAASTETLIYTAPANKKAVGSLTIMNTAAADVRATVLCVTGSVTGSLSGMFTAASGGTTSGTTFAVYNAQVKNTANDDGIPVVISGIVLGPGQSLIAYNNTALSTGLHYVFNGIEEAS